MILTSPRSKHVLVGPGSGPEGGAAATGRSATLNVQFALPENVPNTSEYFFLGRSSGADSERSGVAGGMAAADACSPYQVKYNAKITSAKLVVQGVGADNATPVYPVVYKVDVMRQNAGASWGVPEKVTGGDIDFSISDSFTVGGLAVGVTLFKGSAGVLDIDVDEGDMLGLLFTPETGASLAAHSQMAYIALTLEAR